MMNDFEKLKRAISRN